MLIKIAKTGKFISAAQSAANAAIANAAGLGAAPETPSAAPGPSGTASGALGAAFGAAGASSPSGSPTWGRR